MTPRAIFRTAAIVEAFTWLGLIVGMVMKYGPLDDEVGVQVFGPLHGAAFIAYLIAVAVVFRPLRWSFWTTAFALAASVPPLTTLIFDAWAQRTGRLERPDDPASRRLTDDERTESGTASR